jgi:hypothetical protein
VGEGVACWLCGWLARWMGGCVILTLDQQRCTENKERISYQMPFHYKLGQIAQGTRSKQVWNGYLLKRPVENPLGALRTQALIAATQIC